MLIVIKIKNFKQMQQCYINTGKQIISPICKVDNNYIKIIHRVKIIRVLKTTEHCVYICKSEKK